MRKKDVVLLATVTSFESLSHPSKSELRQFAELFAPLFSASSEEARRHAVAALSQSPNVPPPVAFFIGCQPISISAPFLTASTCLTDEVLVAIARSQGIDHVRAIVRRASLSPTVIDALVGLRYNATARSGGAEEIRPADTGLQDQSDIAPASSLAPALQADQEARDRVAKEEDLRNRIRLLAAHLDRSPSDRLGLRTLSATQEALLVRFARNREGGLLSGVLADLLTSSTWLVERIMVDLSGQQMAILLKSLGMGAADGCYMLTRLYGHLAETDGGQSRAESLWEALDEDDCARRVEAWRRADRYTHGPAETEGDDAFDDTVDRPLRTSATVRRNVAGARGR